MHICVIGGGASGMAAALAASEMPGTRVTLLERQARVGRKLLATGNGRCNLTNLHAGENGYHGADGAFPKGALSSFPPEETLQWFAKLGLLTVAEPSGRVYPYSDQANSVVDVLRFALERAKIELCLGFEVLQARRDGSGFLVESADRRIRCDKLIVACGGLAGTKLGGSLSGYRLLERLGHRITRLRPALVQLKTGWSGVTGLKGVRTNCRAAIFRDDDLFASSQGELQFTEYGLSGPVIFEISRDACQGAGKWSCTLDFLPQISGDELLAHLKTRADWPCTELFTGLLHNRLGRVLSKAAGITLSGTVGQLPDAALAEACRTVKAFSLPLTQPMGMDSAQVTAGGAVTKEFDSETMESRLIPGLYACGEVLDVDGDCGGYNLQWAWSSGRCAGLHAGKERP